MGNIVVIVVTSRCPLKPCRNELLSCVYRAFDTTNKSVSDQWSSGHLIDLFLTRKPKSQMSVGRARETPLFMRRIQVPKTRIYKVSLVLASQT